MLDQSLPNNFFLNFSPPPAGEWPGSFGSQVLSPSAPQPVSLPDDLIVASSFPEEFGQGLLFRPNPEGMPFNHEQQIDKNSGNLFPNGGSFCDGPFNTSSFADEGAFPGMKTEESNQSGQETTTDDLNSETLSEPQEAARNESDVPTKNEENDPPALKYIITGTGREDEYYGCDVCGQRDTHNFVKSHSLVCSGRVKWHCPLCCKGLDCTRRARHLKRLHAGHFTEVIRAAKRRRSIHEKQ